MGKKYRSFLIISPFGIGDLLFTTALLTNIKKNDPTAKVFYLCSKRASPIVLNNPLIEDVFIYERDEYENIKQRSYAEYLRALWNLAHYIGKHKIDIAFDISCHPFYGFLCMVAGIRVRIGLAYKGRDFFLTRKKVFTGYDNRHVADYCLDLLEYVSGFTVYRNCPLNISVEPAAQSWANDYLTALGFDASKKMIGICPFGGASWGKDATRKHWDPDSYAQLIMDLTTIDSCEIMIFAGPSERESAQQLFSRLRGNKNIVLVEKESLERVIALIERSSIFIANDGGLLHIAGALHKPLIGFYGPTNEREYGVYPHDREKQVYMCLELDCRPCYRNFRYGVCQFNRECLRKITVESVLHAAKQLLHVLDLKHGGGEGRYARMNKDVNTRDPLISVITPVYNGGTTLRRAIASVLRQTYQNFELIIINDASSEDIDKVVEEFKDDRIIYLRHESNKGISTGRNTGIKNARGEFIVFLDSDDEFLPEKLKIQSETLNKLDEDVGLLISNMYISVDRNKVFVEKNIASGYLSADSLPHDVYSPPSSWMLRKQCVKKIGFFDEKIFRDDDTDYFIRVLEKTRIYYLDQILCVKYDSIERKGIYNNRDLLGREIFLKKHFDYMCKDRKCLAHYYHTMGKDYLSVGQFDKAQLFFLKAFTTHHQFKYFVKYLRCTIQKKKLPIKITTT